METLSDFIASLHQQGKTLLVISRDMDFVAENLDRLILIIGRIGSRGDESGLRF